MANCYAPDVQFDEDAFSLRGYEQVTGMWRMLCGTTKAKALDDGKLVYSGIEANGKTSKAHREAYYRFTATKRLVRNVIDGMFEFNDQGLIARHPGSFYYWKWSRQALGAPDFCWAGHRFFGKKSEPPQRRI